MNDIVVNKTQSMQRCILRAREEYALAGDDFKTAASHQDAAVLNIIRACELAIDLANHVIKVRKLGVPTGTRQSFELLEQASVIAPLLSQRLRSMVGFRNIAVHDYQQLDSDIVVWVINEGLNDLVAFTDVLLQDRAAD